MYLSRCSVCPPVVSAQTEGQLRLSACYFLFVPQACGLARRGESKKVSSERKLAKRSSLTLFLFQLFPTPFLIKPISQSVITYTYYRCFSTRNTLVFFHPKIPKNADSVKGISTPKKRTLSGRKKIEQKTKKRIKINLFIYQCPSFSSRQVILKFIWWNIVGRYKTEAFLVATFVIPL